MNHHDVFQKSDLGRDKIRNKDLGMLPREARTLLFLIDGEKTYKHYLESFEDSQVFFESGGVAILFELLEDLGYIENIIPPTPKHQPTVTPKYPSASVPLSQLPSEPTRSQIRNEAEFAAEFNQIADSSSDANHLSITDRGFDQTKRVITSENIKSELASYIEANAPAQDAWGYLLNLEQCENDSQLLALIQKIQQSTSDKLGSGMEKYHRALTG